MTECLRQSVDVKLLLYNALPNALPNALYRCTRVHSRLLKSVKISVYPLDSVDNDTATVLQQCCRDSKTKLIETAVQTATV